MIATLCLISCVLAPAQQSNERPEWLLSPRLSKAQELVYRGTTTEESVGSGVQFQRAYRMETRVFVLDTPSNGAELAFFTVLKAHGTRAEDAVQGAVRMELATLDLQGKLIAEPGISLAAPLEGPPTVECGMFVETPQNRVGLQRMWESKEEGRPVHTWRITGNEPVNGTACLKITGVQQSENWDHPRADRGAWRRKDTIWLESRQGIAYRVERVLERKEPARTEPSQRIVTEYELASTLQYPGELHRDRRREILEAHTYGANAAPLVANPGKFAPQLDALLAKINRHLDSQPPTPYRDAVLQVKRRVEAAKRGESPPTLVKDEAVPLVQVAAIGRPAPDFTVPDFTSRESARLRTWFGKPILLVFYNPSANSATDVLHFAQSVQDSYRQQGVVVIGLAVSDDGDKVRKQRADMNLSFPTLSGTGVRIIYAVEATPKFVLIDANAVVRGSFIGWGQETAAEVTWDLKRWLGKEEAPRSEPAAKK